MSAALVKTNSSDTIANFLYNKIISQGGTVSKSAVTIGSEIFLNLEASGGGNLSQWLTPERFQGLDTTGDGTEQTLSNLGYDQPLADAAFPLTAANYPGGFNITAGLRWTLDDACMQEMLYTQELTSGIWSWCTPGKWYVYNQPHFLPATNPNKMFLFGFSWNGTYHIANGFNGILFDRQPADQAQALTDSQNYVQYAFVWENCFIGGDGSNNDAFGTRLGASYGSIFKNIEWYGFNVGVLIYFGLHCKFHNCTFAGNLQFGSYVATGTGSGQSWTIGDGWSGASLSNSASNGVSWNGCHWTVTNTADAACASYGNDQPQIGGDVNVIEGNATSRNSIIFDSQASTVVRTFYIERIHIEHEVDVSWVQVVCHSQAVDAFISRINPFISNNDDLAIVEAQTSPTNIGNNGSITLRLKELSSRAQPLIFRSSGVNAVGYNIWYFDYVYMTDNVTLTTAANWDTTTIGGVTAAIPSSGNLAYLQYP